MKKNIPRAEYPRPQFKRNEWLNLNGEWNFAFDDQNVGESNKWYNKKELEQGITVPFTFETKASGIEDRSPHQYVWYQRTFNIPEDQKNKKIILNIGAADYITKVWINGNFVGLHRGGYDSFSFDITSYVSYVEDNNIVIKIEDSLSKTQPRGKQSWKEDNFSCWYTRTTGIWQTIWLEFVNKELFLKKVKVTSDIEQKAVELEYNFERMNIDGSDYELLTEIRYEDKLIRKFDFEITDEKYYRYKLNIQEGNNRIKLWYPDNPQLYDIHYTLYKDGEKVDKVKSYFGMRKISIENGQILLNNKPIYQKLILDQGYWPETLVTPPSDEAIKKDIELVKEMGFNGVRKHQKIEDDRFYYWADRMGVLVWAEMGSTYKYDDRVVKGFTNELLNVVQELYNHPSIITWVPFNESWGIENVRTDKQQQLFTETVYNLIKCIDLSRPVIANDGWEHTVSDIITIHDYEEEADKFAKLYRSNKEPLVENKISFNHNNKFTMAEGYKYRNQPIILSEFGGIAFQDEGGWGYGKHVENEEELIKRLNNLIEVINKIDYFQGYCYTQLTDVEQEKNGLLTEKREFKVPMGKIKKIINKN